MDLDAVFFMDRKDHFASNKRLLGALIKLEDVNVAEKLGQFWESRDRPPLLCLPGNSDQFNNNILKQ